jgi:hypothetical protein
MPGESNMVKTMTELTTHWDEIHKSKNRDVSWWQENLWLDFLDHVDIAGGAIDVGSGQSLLAIELAKQGFSPVYINDLSGSALSTLSANAKSQGVALTPLEGNVLDLAIPTPVALWHDRAVFHFLTEAAEIEKYKIALITNTAESAFVVISTFSENGPDKCSGMNVHRYSGDELVEVFAPEFKAVRTQKRVHKTPWESEQEFTIAILQKS